MAKLKGYKLINYAKAVSVVVLLLLASLYGIDEPRQFIYFGLHGSYMIWWFIHQYLCPDWASTVFKEEVEGLGAILFYGSAVGILYLIPAYVSFTNATPASPLLCIASILVFNLGNFLNIAADMYKGGAKDTKPGQTVTTGPYARARHLNWTGDWLRYGGLALLSGNPVSFIVPAWVVFINWGQMQKREAGQALKDAPAPLQKYVASTPAFFPKLF